MGIAKIETKIVQACMLCELSKFLSFLVFQTFNKMVVRRGALRYWPGNGLEPIKNECPFLGYPAECWIPFQAFRGRIFLLSRTMQYVHRSTAGLIPFLYSLTEFDESPETDFHLHPVLPIQAAHAVWIW